MEGDRDRGFVQSKGGPNILSGRCRAGGAIPRRVLPTLALSAGLALVPAARDAVAMSDLRFEVPGASEELRADIEASSLLATAEREGQTDPLDVTSAAQAEYGRLIGLFYEEGYYAPRISIRIDGREAADISSLDPPRVIDEVAVTVELGPRFRFGRTEITPLAPGTALPEDFAPGGIARSTLVRDATGAAVDGWRQQGHALADTAEQDVTADHAARELDVRVHIAPGPRLRFGQVQPSGNERTRSERIVEIAGVNTGEVFDPDDVQRAESRLRRTGTFASAALRPAEEANEDGSIDMDVLVEEAPPRRIGVGAEIDSTSGVRLTGFWLHRNLLGGAERLRLEAAIEGIAARVGGLGFSLDARYTRPATLDSDTDLELGLRAVRVDERDYGADSAEAEVSFLRRYSERLTGHAGLSFRFERARYGAGRSLRGNFGTVALPVGLTWDDRDRPLDATSGYYLLAEAMPYAGFDQADHGLRLEMDGRAYTDLGTEGRFVLAGRAQIGAIWGSALSATPRDFLFYSGGGGTVRGLPFQSLGVRQGGVNSGGRGFAALSGELRARVSERFGLAVFADAGYVSAGTFDGASDWHAGAGAGVRYNTPIGPMRLDIAAPLRRNARAAGSGIQIYLGIGQAF
ncbi:MAG: autotransporter translocation and assembly module outer membrane component TamA [Rhodobacteraceae bacterium HLUCCA12]|nr:MAG: autotransporter translocation and assembly module outer membrane component TamA [Rhodobacteraceae bacterium HLUCCA12]